MMLDAFFVALAVFVGVAGHELLGMAMLSRPIVVAPLAGLLLGDVQTGLIVGASLEVETGILEAECAGIMQDFFRKTVKRKSS